MTNNSISDSTWTLLVLSKLKGVGNKNLKRYTKIPNLSSISWDDLLALDPYISRKFTLSDIAEAEDRAHSDFDNCKGEGISIISELDDDYPRLFRYTSDSPIIIYTKGNRKIKRMAVAVVGTREPTKHGEIICNRITEFYAARNWAIVSGLAIGIDSVAHRTALDCDGNTIAVLAHGLDVVAPKRNAKLADEILSKGGTLLSEYPYGTPIFKSSYVKRDRLQAALSLGVILIQTGIKGGSLHASRAALDYERLLAYPYPTKTDIERSEEKIQGILKIAGSSEKEKADYLECGAKSLLNLYQILSKKDYLPLEKKMLSNMEQIARRNSSLFDS